jgi:hypothetical protein
MPGAQRPSAGKSCSAANARASPPAVAAAGQHAVMPEVIGQPAFAFPRVDSAFEQQLQVWVLVAFGPDQRPHEARLGTQRSRRMPASCAWRTRRVCERVRSPLPGCPCATRMRRQPVLGRHSDRRLRLLNWRASRHLACHARTLRCIRACDRCIAALAAVAVTTAPVTNPAPKTAAIIARVTTGTTSTPYLPRRRGTSRTAAKLSGASRSAASTASPGGIGSPAGSRTGELDLTLGRQLRRWE